MARKHIARSVGPVPTLLCIDPICNRSTDCVTGLGCPSSCGTLKRSNIGQLPSQYWQFDQQPFPFLRNIDGLCRCIGAKNVPTSLCDKARSIARFIVSVIVRSFF